MALPKFLHPSLTPQELTFIAEEEHIEIIPSFSMGKVRLISGVYGPFIPPSKSKVPLWLALSLKRKKKCRIVCPEWLTADNLQAIVTAEKENPESFISLPRYYIEVSKLLLDIAPTDLSSPSQIHSLLLTLRHIRLSKIRLALRPPSQSQSQSQSTSTSSSSSSNPYGTQGQGGSGSGSTQAADLGPFSGGGEYLKLTGLTPFEVGEMKGFLKGVMGSMRWLSDLAQGTGEEEGEGGDGMREVGEDYDMDG